MKNFLRKGAKALTIGFCCASALMGFSVPASAAVSAETTRNYAPVERYTLNSANPESGSTVNNLMTIATKWDRPEDGFTMRVNDYDINLVKIYNASGKLVKTAGLDLDAISGEVTIWINGSLSAVGVYTVVIPAGAVYDSEVASMACVETKLVYYIGTPSLDPQPVSINEAEPADKSIVNKIDVISTTWNDPAITWMERADGDGLAVSDNAQAVEIKNAENTVVSYGSLTLNDGVVEIHAATPVTEPGEYTVSILPDMVYDVRNSVKVDNSGNAKTDIHYTVEYPRCTFVSSDPENNSKVLGAFSSIMTTWTEPGQGNGMAVSDDPQAVEIRNADDDALVSYATLEKTDEGVKINVTTEFEVQNEVHYDVIIKADKIYDVDASNNPIEHTYNREVKLSYTLVSPRCVLNKTTPEDGATVEELKEIATEWYSPGIGNFFCSVARGGVEVYDAEDNLVTSGKLDIDRSFKIKIVLDETVNKSGEYKVVIKPNLVYEYTIGEGNSMIKFEETYNEETELHYTVAIVRCALAEVDPADHSTVAKLDVINTKWNYPGLGRGLAVSDDVTKIIVRDADASPVSNGTLELVGDDGEVRITLTDPVTTKGSFTVTIFPSSVFEMLDFSTPMEETGNKGTVLFYDVDPSLGAVESVDADNAGIVYENGAVNVYGMENPVITVYGVNGEAVAKSATSELNVTNLVNGVYVVTAADAERVITNKILVK